MPLTHVCIYEKNGWKRITLQEAVKQHPLGNVSASSELFLCELCNQYVILTKKGEREPYFKHNRAEDEKNCIERSFGQGVDSIRDYRPNRDNKSLPIRIVVLDRQHFKFQIGLFYPGEDYDREGIFTIESEEDTYSYSFERINREGVTYLDVGTCVSNTYQITTDDAFVSENWPWEIKGVKEYTLFKKHNGNILPYDSDVKIHEPYLALTKHELCGDEHVSSLLVCQMREWKIYEVCANDYSKQAAKFFVGKFHCRLTDVPIKVNILWPIVVKAPFFTYYKEGSIFALINGNAGFQMFPYAFLKPSKLEDASLIQVRCNDRQQMLSVGRTVNTLVYTYLKKTELNYKSKKDVIEVLDGNNNQILDGTNVSCPANRTLRFTPSYDGFFVQIKEGWEEIRIPIKADQMFQYEEITEGYEYRIYYGNDVIWSIRIQTVNSISHDKVSDKELLLKLSLLKGKQIPISHSFGAVAKGMKEYPLTRVWVLSQIKEGRITEKAKRMLLDMFSK